MKPSKPYLSMMRERSEEFFIENTGGSDLWHILSGLLNYPIVIQTGVYLSSARFVIQNEDDLKAFVYTLLHEDD